MEELQIAIRVTKEWVGKHSMKAAMFSKWQLRLLLMGSGFFIAWHIWAIVERSHAP